MRPHGLALGLAVPLALAGCGEPGAGDDGHGRDDDSTETIAGTYQLSSFYDLTQTGVLPDLANDTLRALSGLEDNPAHTIIELLRASNAPVVATVLDVLPGVLVGPFEGWFNDFVFARLYDGVPVAMQIAGLVDDVATIATRFEVVTHLELGAVDEVGDATARHALAGVAFTVADHRFVIDAPEFLSDLTAADEIACNAVHIEESSPRIEDGRLDLGDHTFALPIGQYAIFAMNQILMDRFGVADLAGALALLFDCDGLAATLASQCVAFVCVGHQDELRGLCQAGVGLVADQVEGALGQLDVKVLRHALGEARMWDATEDGGATDGVIDRLDHGQWEGELDLGAGPHPIAADFIGLRIAGPGAGVE